jgi:sec-independent protein translocase protein TatA
MPFNLGPGEMILFGMIAVLLFGNKLPSVMRSLGKGMTEFQKGIKGVKDEFDSAMRDEPKSARRPAPAIEYDEPTAPKFEPPTMAPQSSPAEGAA